MLQASPRTRCVLRTGSRAVVGVDGLVKDLPRQCHGTQTPIQVNLDIGVFPEVPVTPVDQPSLQLHRVTREVRDLSAGTLHPFP